MRKKHSSEKHSAVAGASTPTPTSPTKLTQHEGAPRGTPSQEEIRVRAYLLWEAAGQPSGNEEAFWLQAERELSG